MSGTAWDNYDLNMETLHGKDSLHVTVGISYQDVRQAQDMDAENLDQVAELSSSVAEVPRRSYKGTDKEILPSRRNLNTAKFKFEQAGEDKIGEYDMKCVLLRATNIDFMWLVMSREKQLPFFNGFTQGL